MKRTNKGIANRHAAVKKLIAAHQEEFDGYILESQKVEVKEPEKV